MNNIDLTYVPFTLQLNEHIITSNTVIRERKGFIVKLKRNKYVGYGEVTPLPEFGSESFEQDEKAIKNFNFNLQIKPNNFIQSLDRNLQDFSHLPAFRHGIEQALLNLFCSEANISLNEVLNCSSKNSIKVNGIIGILKPEETVTKALELVKSGFSTIKLKVGRNDFDEDFECLSATRAALGNDIRIRIDVNGKWEAKEAIINSNRLMDLNLEFIEQPVNNFLSFKKLSFKTNIPLSVDESVRNFDDAIKFIESNSVKAIVLKPMLLGGIINTLRIIEAAEKQHLKVIISSSFETSLGRSLAIFAASTVKGEIAHGLDTARFLRTDLYKNPYPVINGKISLTTNK